MPQGVFVALRFATVLHMADTKAARREVGVGEIKRQARAGRGVPTGCSQASAKSLSQSAK